MQEAPPAVEDAHVAKLYGVLVELLSAIVMSSTLYEMRGAALAALEVIQGTT